VLAAARTGAGWALRRLYDDLAPAVAGYLRTQGIRDHEDVTSEVFLGVFSGLGAFQGDEAAFRTWVFTIAHHRLVDERRREGRRPRTEPLADARSEPSGGDVEEEALAALGGVWVQEALAQLTEDQRQVVVLRILAGLGVEEVSRVTGKRNGAVRVLQHRAIERLRRSLERGRISDPTRDGRGG
jgi:RNA polymerase sigma factor (sigma-70 family)